MGYEPPVVATGLRRAFRSPDGGTVVAVDDVSFSAESGVVTAITGPSGSGKSTLLQLLAGLDRPSRGDVRIDGTSLSALSDRKLARLRRKHVGFVFQSYNLIASLTARDNIALPIELDGRTPHEDRLFDLAERLGIADRLDHKPSALSGGQQQRVAIARALLPRPAVVFADEPTGALDVESSEQLLVLLTELAHDEGQTVVVVTHDPAVAKWADEIHHMSHGELSRAPAGSLR